jgi:hypothetical protein
MTTPPPPTWLGTGARCDAAHIIRRGPLVHRRGGPTARAEPEDVGTLSGAQLDHPGPDALLTATYQFGHDMVAAFITDHAKSSTELEFK